MPCTLIVTCISPCHDRAVWPSFRRVVTCISPHAGVDGAVRHAVRPVEPPVERAVLAAPQLPRVGSATAPHSGLLGPPWPRVPWLSPLHSGHMFPELWRVPWSPPWPQRSALTLASWDGAQSAGCRLQGTRPSGVGWAYRHLVITPPGGVWASSCTSCLEVTCLLWGGPTTRRRRIS